MREFGLFENIIVFYRSESFDMQVGTVRLTASEKFRIKLKVLFRNNASGDMYLRYRLVIVFFDHLHHSIYIHLPSFFTLLDQTRIRTEFAVVNTNVRRLYMEVTVEIGIIAMFFLTDIVG